MVNAVVNLNGAVVSPDQAKVSVFDRSFLYGDSLYEVARSYQGRFFMLDEHLERLRKSAELCLMTLSQTLEQYKSEIDRTFQAFRRQKGFENAEAYCRIIVSRGTGKIGFGLSSLMTPTQYVIIVQPLETPWAGKVETGTHGMKLQVVERLRNSRRALDPAMKSGNYLNSLLAYLESTGEGYDDALLLDSDGMVTEGTTFNIFYVRRGIIATPPLEVGILDGITRKLVLELAGRMGIECRVLRFPAPRLHEADEVFVSSSIREIFPVLKVDHREFKSMGPVTRKLREAFAEVTKA